MNNFQKQVKEVLANSTEVFPDKVVNRKNGEVCVRRMFFYTNGQTAESWAEKVMNALVAAGIKAETAEQRTCRNDWPKDSYFEVVVSEVKN